MDGKHMKLKGNTEAKTCRDTPKLSSLQSRFRSQIFGIFAHFFA